MRKVRKQPTDSRRNILCGKVSGIFTASAARRPTHSLRRGTERNRRTLRAVSPSSSQRCTTQRAGTWRESTTLKGPPLASSLAFAIHVKRGLSLCSSASKTKMMKKCHLCSSSTNQRHEGCPICNTSICVNDCGNARDNNGIEDGRSCPKVCPCCRIS